MQATFAERSIAFLSWLDAFERIDTLIMEMRHVQETIASQLGAADEVKAVNGARPQDELRLGTASYYEVFNFEDNYLWGQFRPDFGESKLKDWSELFSGSGLHSVPEGCDILATLWCPEFYPASGEKVQYRQLSDEDKERHKRWFDLKKLEQLNDDLRVTRREVSEKNLSSASDGRLYETMRYLQLLKRDTLRDKLVLARKGWEVFEFRQGYHGSDPLVGFLVIRRAVLERLHARLDYFRDVLSAVQEILNLSLERDPPPTVRRRRDQGIYTTDLADTCDYIAREIVSYFTFLRAGRANKDGYLNLDEKIRFLLHRYERSYTSSAQQDRPPPTTLAERTRSRDPLESRLRAGFVRTSYWMPERPDLQPIIAHEVAHLLLMHEYKHLDRLVLARLDGELGPVLRQILYILERYDSRFDILKLSADTRLQIVQECAADFISIAVHGTSYLFAHFMELICLGSEDFFARSLDIDIAYGLTHAIEENVTFIQDHIPLWYLRVALSLTFVESLEPRGVRPPSQLAGVVRKGIRELTERVLKQYYDWMKGEQKQDWEAWFELTGVLEDIVRKSSLAKATAAWRRSRADEIESWNARTWIQTPLNRQHPPLPPEIRQVCLGSWLDRLVELPRMLAQALIASKGGAPGSSFEITYKEILAVFRDRYLHDHRSPTPEEQLFTHLIDIPWQSALLTAHDFLGVNRDGNSEASSRAPDTTHVIERKSWFQAIHEFNWLGRDLYHMALEYVIWFERPAIGRLKAAYRWLSTVDTHIQDLVVASGGGTQTSAALRTLQDLLDRALGRPDLPENKARRNSPKVETFEKFWAKPTILLPDLEPIRSLSTKEICEQYPAHCKDRDGLEGVDLERWTHIYDFIASEKMDTICCDIHKTVCTLFKTWKDQNSPVLAAFRDPTAAGVGSNEGKLVGIIRDLVKTAHYLMITPYVHGDKQASTHPRYDVLWTDIFMQYLDVPIVPRKTVMQRSPGAPPTAAATNGEKYVKGLVPTKSFQIDRMSLLTLRDETGHYPTKNWCPWATLLWRPWGLHGDDLLGSQEDEYGSTILTASLLGRFDHIVIEPAKHTARRKQWRRSDPYFRRQQIGLPFAASVRDARSIARLWAYDAKCNPFPPLFKQPADHSSPAIAWPSRVPIATINILLSQRSARLTFVERLFAEDAVFESYLRDWHSPYRKFKPDSDIGLLTDGWGDIFLMLFAEYSPPTGFDFAQYVRRCGALGKRLKGILELRRALFNDPLVVRSETSFTPVAVDTALLSPDQYHTSISVRFRASLSGVSLADSFEDHVKRKFAEFGLAQAFSYVRVSGRTDYSFTTKPIKPTEALPIYEKLFSDRPPIGHGSIFEALRHQLFHVGKSKTDKEIVRHIDSTTTIISDFVL